MKNQIKKKITNLNVNDLGVKTWQKIIIQASQRVKDLTVMGCVEGEAAASSGEYYLS